MFSALNISTFNIDKNILRTGADPELKFGRGGQVAQNKLKGLHFIQKYYYVAD